MPWQLFEFKFIFKQKTTISFLPNSSFLFENEVLIRDSSTSIIPKNINFKHIKLKVFYNVIGAYFVVCQR